MAAGRPRLSPYASSLAPLLPCRGHLPCPCLYLYLTAHLRPDRASTADPKISQALRTDIVQPKSTLHDPCTQRGPATSSADSSLLLTSRRGGVRQKCAADRGIRALCHRSCADGFPHGA